MPEPKSTDQTKLQIKLEPIKRKRKKTYLKSRILPPHVPPLREMRENWELRLGFVGEGGFDSREERENRNHR